MRSDALPEPSTRQRVWWANPLSPLVLLVAPTMLLAWLIPRSDYLTHWKTPKYFGYDGFVRSVIAILAMAIGAAVTTGGRLRFAPSRDWPALSSVTRRSLRRSFMWLYRATCVAYIVWLVSAIRRGLRISTIVNALVSQSNYSGVLKRYFETIPGVTTLTQVAISAVIIGVLLTCGSVDKAVSRRVYLLVGLAVVRGFLLTERLAIVELVVPWLIIRSAHSVAKRTRPARRLLIRLGPILALPVLLLGFSLFEYSRSWTFARKTTNDTFVEYSGYRLLGYYATSYSNGELYRQTLSEPGRLPYFTVQFLWQAPIVSSLVTYEGLAGEPPVTRVLETSANPEFNSEGGLSVPYIDYGNAGAAAYFLLMGLFIGWLYRLFAASRLLGMLLYPPFFVGMLEMPRYLYWGQGRVTLGLVGLLASGVLATTRARRATFASRALVSR